MDFGIDWDSDDDYSHSPRSDDGSVECTKRAYRSAREAKAAHRQVSWRIRVYRCPDCNRWHVTNQEKR